MIRVLVVEHKSLIRGGIVALLSDQFDISVAASLDSVGKTVPTALELRPDVTLVGAGVARADGLAVSRVLHTELPGCGTVIMADQRRPGELRRAVAAHVMGYVLIDTPPQGLVDAVRRVARGERVVDSELAFTALGATECPLTSREVDVLRLAAQGASSAEIANHLFLSVRTVRNHMSRIIGKIGARNRIDAIRIADNAGWL